MNKHFKIFGHWVSIYSDSKAKRDPERKPKAGDVVVMIPYDGWREKRNNPTIRANIAMTPNIAESLCGTVQVVDRVLPGIIDRYIMKGIPQYVFLPDDFTLAKPVE